MQKFRSAALFIFMTMTLGTVSAQDEYFQEKTGLPGDHLNLSAVLELFKDAKSVEAFEKSLNTKDQNVNNLDLDEDGKTDYIRVQDHVEADAHAITLQVAVAESEMQDVAVIEIEKTGDAEAILQIIGDEDIYGEAWIVEPFEEEDMGKGPSYDHRVRLVVNVWAWPSVRFVYRPSYRPWISPWRFRLYPRWWKPWRPLGWGLYFGHHRHHHRHYHVAPVHRVVHAHRIYVPHRQVSATVHVRHNHKVQTYRARPQVARRGSFQTTKTVTKIGPNGGKVSATSSKGVGVAKGKHGQKAIGGKSQKTVTATGPQGKSVSKTQTSKKAAATNGHHQKVGKTSRTSRSFKGRNGDQITQSKQTKVGAKRSPAQVKAGKKKTKSASAKTRNGTKVHKRTVKRRTVRKKR